MVRAINERELATRLLVITWSYSAARLLGCSLRELAAGRCLLLRGGSGRGGRERSTSSLLFRLSEHVCVTPLIVCLCVLQVSHLTQSAYVFFRVSCPVCVTPHRLLMCSASVTRVLPLIESQTCLVSQSRWNSNDDNGNDSRHDNGNSGNSGNEDDDDNGNDDNSGNEDDDANRHSFGRDIFSTAMT